VRKIEYACKLIGGQKKIWLCNAINFGLYVNTQNQVHLDLHKTDTLFF